MLSNYQIIIDPYGVFGIIISYLYLFFVGGFIGYILELFFRRFVSMKKWINPGFLKGPCLPLYGFGVCALHLICKLCFAYLLDEADPMVISKLYQMLVYDANGNEVLFIPKGNLSFASVSIITVLLVGAILTLIEFIAGLIFIKGFHVRLWDYSKMKGNLMGLICPVFSIIWSVVGALYWFLLRGKVERLLLFMIPHIWKTTFVLGAILAVFIIDIIYSIRLTANVRKEAKLLNRIIDYERFKLEYRMHKTSNRLALIRQTLSPLGEKLAPVTEKIEDILYKVKSSMYIDNEIPTKNNSETPRSIEKQIDEKTLLDQVNGLVSSSYYWISYLSNISALLFDSLNDVNWVGFYIYNKEEKVLKLGPFNGKVACSVIPYGKGVCGTSIKDDIIYRVANVHEFKGHIACDSASNSEIVIPIHKNNEIFGVLDIDSPKLNRFSVEDEKVLRKVVEIVEKAIEKENL